MLKSNENWPEIKGLKLAENCVQKFNKNGLKMPKVDQNLQKIVENRWKLSVKGW